MHFLIFLFFFIVWLFRLKTLNCFNKYCQFLVKLIVRRCLLWFKTIKKRRNLMNKIKNLYSKLEKVLSGVKFAVVIILLFAIALTFGTFMESYHGTDYANRLVYKSWWFITIEVLMFVSIVMATIVRLPPKKRLYGFYTIHSGLIILFIGSFFTYINGVDGSLQLLPNTPARKIFIDEDVLVIEKPRENKVLKLTLPYTPWPRNLNKTIQNITVYDFLPYAEKSIKWRAPHSRSEESQHSSSYLLFNENMSQDFTLSLNPQSDFKSMHRMGLLNLHYMPKNLAECFAKESPSGFIVWSLVDGSCSSEEKKKYKMGQTDKGTDFLLIEYNGDFLKYFPNYSPMAVNDDLTKNPDSPYRVLSRKVFEDKANLFLFGKKVSYFVKRKKKWVLKDLTGKVVKLPWMGFKLSLTRHEDELVPVEVPEAVTPIQDNGEIIKGRLKAARIKVDSSEYWVTNEAPLQLKNGDNTLTIGITNTVKELPYQITLEKFVMNTNPGTKDPASYESYVQLLDGRSSEGLKKHHVFMNNPLKYDDFTFYQSSYFPLEQNQFGSVFSVNYDPGRFFKYLGCFFIVFGSIWHYILNRRKKVSP